MQDGSPPGFSPGFLTPGPLRQGPWPITSLALDVSGRCNLACRYCAEASTQPERTAMTAETLDAAWRLLCPDGAPRRGMSIRLGSGEPMLGAALLRKLDNRIRASGGSAADHRPGVFLTTNGTLLDQEACAWLAASGWHVKISLDGPKDVHDAWRTFPDGRGTFETIAGAVASLADSCDRLSATAVLCRGTDPFEVFEGIASLGIRRIELVPVAHLDPAVCGDEDDIAAYRAFLDDHVERLLDAPDRETLPQLVRFERCVVRAMGYTNAWIPCGAGRSFVGVDASGDLYPCFRFVGVDAYRLGSLEEGLDSQRAAAFQEGAGRPYNLREPCNTCWAAPFCGGACYSCAEFFGDGEPLPTHCAYTRADAAAAVRLVQALRRSDPERLLAYLPGLPDLGGVL